MTAIVASWCEGLRAAHRVAEVRAGALIWLGVVAGGGVSTPVAATLGLGCVVTGAAVFRRRGIVGGALLLVALVAGAAQAQRAADATALQPGAIDLHGSVLADGRNAGDAWELLVATEEAIPEAGRGAKLLLRLEARPGANVGDIVHIRGALRTTPGWFGRHHHTGTVRGAKVVVVADGGVVFSVANAVRSHVLEHLDVDSPSRALLAGFIVGETADLSDDHIEDLRRTGLSHYVAVSGSNVALVLVAAWIVAGLLRLPRWLRIVWGVAVVIVFAVVTRWEPSVVRASVMAGLVLAARFVGYPLTSWQAIGMGVGGVLLVSPELGVDPGFQLSVAATVGVMVAAADRGALRRLAVPRFVSTTLLITLAAQLAVLPIVLVRFGEAPLVSPLANLVAAPLVTVATAVGWFGAMSGIEPLVTLASIPAELVLGVAAIGSGLPQLGPGGAIVGVVLAVLWRYRLLRPAAMAAVLAGAALWSTSLVPNPVASGPAVTFLDVGQGDAIVIGDGAGRHVLVDGGADGPTLRDALARNGLDSFDAVLVTHGDADHAAGLAELLLTAEVGLVGYPALQPISPLLEQLIGVAEMRGIEAAEVRTGDRLDLGSIRIDVLSPARRYAGENDGSLVLWLTLGATDVLLTGDIEAVAQAELPDLRPDVVQIPHHGSATTDLRWLEATLGDVAVISVGPNRHGHPAPVVLDAVAASGAVLYTTWDDGDVIIPLAATG